MLHAGASNSEADHEQGQQERCANQDTRQQSTGQRATHPAGRRAAQAAATKPDRMAQSIAKSQPRAGSAPAAARPLAPPQSEPKRRAARKPDWKCNSHAISNSEAGSESEEAAQEADGEEGADTADQRPDRIEEESQSRREQNVKAMLEDNIKVERQPAMSKYLMVQPSDLCFTTHQRNGSVATCSLCGTLVLIARYLK